MSTLTRKFRRGEIYYIKSFPTCGHEQRSGRPAVIVSSDEINAHSEVVEVVFLTLKDKPDFPTHVFIDRGPCINSTILCEQITSVAVDRVGDYMCRVPEHVEEALDEALKESLHLSSKPSKLDEENISRRHEAYVGVLKELDNVKLENKALKHELDSCHKVLEDLNLAKNKADMYERMYNDLLSRIIGGAK